MTKKIMKKRKSNNYFTKVHENAILEYIDCTEQTQRDVLYREVIRPAFVEMIDKIVFTYKFTTLPNIATLKEECEVHLITVLSNYDKNRGSKAFSYFGAVTKNWFIARVKKNSTQLKRESSFEEVSKDAEMQHLTIYNLYDERRNWNEFWQHLWGEINRWDNQRLKDNERKVLEAIKILLAEPDMVPIFNKKAIYHEIREITKLNTKQVLNSLTKFRFEYGTFKKKWDE